MMLSAEAIYTKGSGSSLQQNRARSGLALRTEDVPAQLHPTRGEPTTYTLSSLPVANGAV
jgi:hypothetical protein